MPGLQQVLQGNDFGFLRMVAAGWGVEIADQSPEEAIPRLVSIMKDHDLALEIVESLPSEARRALDELAASNGKMPAARFFRLSGEIRSMGAGRRDRDRPDLNPASPAEMLWYRGLIGKSFLNLLPEPQEFVFIPDEILTWLEHVQVGNASLPAIPASPGSLKVIRPANDRILNQSCALLAARRNDESFEEISRYLQRPSPQVLASLLQQAGVLDADFHPVPDAARQHLESPRAEALSALVLTWMESRVFNELLQLPGLAFEGEWKNDPLLARRIILNLLKPLSVGKWFDLTSLIETLRSTQPDFQRPAGDYDSWFIRRKLDNVYLRGYASWDEVDGTLARYIICGPMHWLGLVDLASSSTRSKPEAFRYSPWAPALLAGSLPVGLDLETGKVRVTASGQMHIPRLAPRSAGYLAARFGERATTTGETTTFRLTATSLERARQQGLTTRHLLQLLHRHGEGAVSPVLVQMLERWEVFGRQASFEEATLLRLASPALLEGLKKTHAARYLGETLNPAVVMIKPGGARWVAEALREMGYLADE